MCVSRVCFTASFYGQLLCGGCYAVIYFNAAEETGQPMKEKHGINTLYDETIGVYVI